MDIYGADQAISVNIGTEEELRKQNQVLAARLVYQLDLLSSLKCFQAFSGESLGMRLWYRVFTLLFAFLYCFYHRLGRGW